MKFSQEFDVVFNKKKRLEKAITITKILENNCLPKKLQTLNCLEIGCAAGLMSEYFNKYFNKTYCIEVDENALTFCAQKKKNNLFFLKNSAEALSFKSASFDIIICNHIYEHVDNAELLFKEIKRTLKPTGVVYVACTNKYWFIEPHYNLPFLSFLPQPLADMYLSIFKNKKEYNIKLRNYINIKKLFKEFQVQDITLQVIKNSDKYNLKIGFLKYVPSFIIKLMYYFIPNYIFILKKNKI